MSLSISEIRTWKPGELTAMGAEVTGQGIHLEEEAAAVARQGSGISGNWDGPAATAAASAIGRESKAEVNGAAAMYSLADALDHGAQTLAAAKEKVLSAVDAATGAGFHVADDGSVTPPPPQSAAVHLAGTVLNPVALAAEAAQLQEKASAHAAAIKAALVAAQEANQHVASDIRKAVEALHEQAASPVYGSFASATASTDAKVTKYLNGSAKLPTSPAALNALWMGLSTGDKRALAAKFPNIGQMDGIPCAERDLLNRSGLDTQLQQMQSEKAALLTKWKGHVPPMHEPGYQLPPSPQYAQYAADMARVATLSGLIKGSLAIKSKLSQKGSQHFLLGYKPHAGLGQAIVAQGNPDTATNVVTFVPGMTSKLAGMGGPSGGLTRMEHLYNWMKWNEAPGQRSAVVTWYGYNAPQNIAGDTRSPADAHAGAPALAHFTHGLRATHDGAPSYNSVFAHSYGATVAFDSAYGKNHLDANSIAVMGPAGMGDATNVHQLHLQSYHGEKPTVWTTTASGDAIPMLSDGPAHFLGLTHNGIYPNTPGDGVRQFDSNPLHWYEAQPLSAHGSYWDPGSQSLQNLGAIGLNEPKLVN